MRLLKIEYRTYNGTIESCETLDELMYDKNYNKITWLHIKDTDFKETINLPTLLQTLYLLNCKYIEYIYELPNQLEYLNVNGCNCFSIDKWFQSELRLLHSIHIKMNRLSCVPKIPNNVISLDISNNSIKKLPSKNCFPSNIQSIDLSNNLLEDLPSWLLLLNPNIQIQLSGNRFWFNHYENISLNREITLELLDISIRFFTSFLTIKLLKVMKRLMTSEEFEQFLLHHPIYANILRPKSLIRSIPIKHIKKTTAEKEQNVHNSDIQDSFCNCVKIIMDSTEPYNPNYLDEVYKYYIEDGSNIQININFINHINELCKLDLIVSRIGVKYHEIFERIWAITEVHTDKKEIRKILREDVYNARNVCFTGKITKLVNSLSGFIEGISIGYNENDQINNRVIMIMRACRNTPELIKDKVKEALNELNIEKDKQLLWLNELE